MNRLEKVARAGADYARVNALIRDPDPAPDHEYQRDVHSGAGNCTCGAAERHRLHPHEFLGMDSAPWLCVCRLGEDAKCHVSRSPSEVDNA